MLRCRIAGRRCLRTQVTASVAASYAAARSHPSALRYRSPGLAESTAATQPSGDRTDSPMPLSSQTNSTGIRSPEWSHQPAVLNAATALAWLIDASPNEHTATASVGHGVSVSRRRPRSTAKPSPTARGRCDPIVEVVGMICRSGWPNILCRPPAPGSAAEATSPRRTSRTGSVPGNWAARAQ